jgi:hypothetical protein
LFFSVADLHAQQRKKTGELPPEVMAWTISTIEPWPPGKYKSLKDALIDNEVYLPVIFSSTMFPDYEKGLRIDSLKYNLPIPPVITYSGRGMRPMFSYYRHRKHFDDLTYRYVLENHPEQFKYTMRQLPTVLSLRPEAIEKPAEYLKLDIKSTITPPETVDPVIKFIPDRKYWISTFQADIKFSQNRSSSNWSAGELKTMTINTYTRTTYNYAKNKVAINNSLQTTFNVNNSPKDTMRNYAVSTDELRITSQFLLNAVRNWNYSTSITFFTPMGNRYIANTKNKQTAFLSPFTLNVGVGMTFAANPKFKKPNRSMNINLSIEPLAFNYKYSKSEKINLGAHFPKDENGQFVHVTRDIGSKATLTKTSRFGKNGKVTWFSRFYYFTNYDYAYGEFENKFDFILNKYFSTSIHLFLKYDDRITKTEDIKSYLQMNEVFGFGFSYRW